MTLERWLLGVILGAAIAHKRKTKTGRELQSYNENSRRQTCWMLDIYKELGYPPWHGAFPRG